MITLMERKKRHMQSFVKQTLFLALILLGTMGAWAQTTIDLSENFTTDIITAHNGDVLTGTLAQNVQISIENNATVTLQNVSINANGSWTSGVYAGITCLGNATIILEGTNTVKGFYPDNPGIYVPTGYTLTIQGSGSLNASSNGLGAGIGGGSQINCGNIVIAGGTITATGEEPNAGIGAGFRASCGTISITGGTVNATGGRYGSGIGTGHEGSCGAITISGGFVTATGGGNAAGIGAGYYHASCVSIDITGGTVTATGGTNAAGIGTGQGSSCGPITITDGVTQVTAIKGEDAPNSIGAGLEGECGTVTIGGMEYWKNSQYQNGGDDAQTGIVKSPYYYPIPNYTLGEIPSGWTVTANGTEVMVTPYESPNQDKGYAIVPLDADIVLIPADTALIKSVNLTDPLAIPLTFEAKTAGATVTFTKSPAPGLSSLSVEYSTDGITWTNYSEPITLSDSGNKVSFRGTNATYANLNIGSHFSCSKDCYIYGNIMSLINKDNFATNTTLTADYTFYNLFENDSNLYNHPSKPLMLPATTLTSYCYYGMFKGCSNLTAAPALPATNLAQFCYYGMFYECSNLTAAPALPATNLAKGCYGTMFAGCSSLTEVPELPASTLDDNCYSGMFANCSSLTEAPRLPATTLAYGCYYYMFYGCSKLNSITCLATSGIDINYSTTDWLEGVATSGTFIKADSAGLNSGATGTFWTKNYASGIPTGWMTPEEIPLTFEAKTAGATVTFTKSTAQELSSLSVEYSTDGISWTNYTVPITLSDSGNKVSFRGTNATYAANRYTHGSHFSCSNDCYIYGNIMSLINKDNFATNTTLTAENTFLSLFQHNPLLYNHPSKPLMLPATTLTPYCYMNMFNGCSNLTTAPALPATTLTPYCYSSMFLDCSNLTTAPVLPATELADFCYSDMFAYCSSLTTAPALPATMLDEHCYESMFAKCSSLTAAPALPATMLYLGCYWNMFNGCSSLTEAPALPATMLDEHCYESMFAKCSSLTAAPALPATMLPPYCYRNMFNGCSNLNSITCLATTFLETDCTENWISGVASTGTFTKAASADWSGKTGSDSIPSGWRTFSVVPGEFTVNATGGKVRFSAGNLQATTNNFGTTWTWAFATNQWDYIGNAVANTSINGNGTVSTNGTVDLFGWVGASSTWTGAAQYGISNETNTNSADTYGNEIGEALKSDWGNNIDSSWRTLTIDEWQYLFHTRASGSTVNGTSNARYTHATINGVNGIILFPDGVTIASGEATQWGAINGTSAWGTQCTSDQWTAFVAKGCVFLPAAGDRINGTSISSAGSQGLYWSSTSYTTDSNPAYCIKFGSNSLNTNEFYYRFYGLSVRLVRDAN